MRERRIAIGDIHGCDLALRGLLGAIQPTARDLIITLGDYVDRGPHSRQVIEALVELQGQCRTVHLLGNHELMMRAALADSANNDLWLQCGGDATLASYNDSLANVPQGHIGFLQNCVPYFELDDYFFVHANYTPTLPLDLQPDYALYWEHLTVHMPGPHYSGKVVVLGHTPQRDGNILHTGHLVCLDTYCYGGKYLSAWNLDDGQLWQTDTAGRLRVPSPGAGK